MTSQQHEVPIRLFQRRPELIVEILESCFGTRLPEFKQVVGGSEALTSCDPLDLVCDNVGVLQDEEGNRLHAVIVEIQRQVDKRKEYTWPAYLYQARAKLECPVTLVAICFDTRTAKWAGRPVESGHPGSRFAPLVLGPDEIKRAAQESSAEYSAELLLLELAEQCNRTSLTEESFNEFSKALAPLPIGQAVTYAIYAKALLTKEAIMVLENVMARETYPYQTEYKSRFYREGEAHGEERGEERGAAKGRAEEARELLLTALTERGLPISSDVEERVRACQDIDQLHRWFKLALSASTVNGVFADEILSESRDDDGSQNP